MKTEPSERQTQATAQLCAVLDRAIEYELNMQRSLAVGPGMASTKFNPAALDAYRRIQLLLRSPLTAETLKLVHAELSGVFECEHYGGIQFQFCAIQIDEWLDAMDGRHGLPCFYDLIHDRLYLSHMDAGPLRHRQYLIAQNYMERRDARRQERKRCMTAAVTRRQG